MRIRVVAVGKIKARALRSLLDDYLRRIGRYCKVDEIEIDGKARALDASLSKAIEGASVVALDVGGEALTSQQLAKRLEALASRGKGVVAFVIGGADGLPAGVRARADACWSLSSLTFPHRLARLVLAEQLYRAMTILRGEPYDH